MPRDPYKSYDGASYGLDIVGRAAGAASAFSNPMGGVQNAQRAYHTHQYHKIQMKGMGQGLANEERAIQRQREMQSSQVQASSMSYGANGIGEENGFVRDRDGKIRYVGGKK